MTKPITQFDRVRSTLNNDIFALRGRVTRIYLQLPGLVKVRWDGWDKDADVLVDTLVLE